MKEMTFSEAAKLCQDFQQPIPISVDGSSKVYLMSEEIYSDFSDAKEYEEVMVGVNEIEEGHFIDGETFFKGIEQKYGL